MAKVEQKFLTLRHPLTADQQQLVMDAAEMFEAQGFMAYGHSFQGGSVEEVEFRKTLDYSREERRAAKRSGQKLAPNQFKSLMPTGWKPMDPNDPRLQDPTPETQPAPEAG